MRLTYTSSLEDFIDAQRVHAWRKYSPALAGFQRIAEPIVGIALLLLAWYLITVHASSAFVMIEVVCGLYVLLNRLIIAPSIYRRAYRRRHVDPPQPGLVEFTPERIYCESPGRANGTIQWIAVRGYLDKPKTILLYTAPGLFLYIPKWALSADHHQELLGLLAQHNIPNTYPK